MQSGNTRIDSKNWLRIEIGKKDLKAPTFEWGSRCISWSMRMRITTWMIKLVQKTYRSEDWIVSCDAWRGSEWALKPRRSLVTVLWHDRRVCTRSRVCASFVKDDLCMTRVIFLFCLFYLFIDKGHLHTWWRGTRINHLGFLVIIFGSPKTMTKKNSHHFWKPWLHNKL